MGAYRRIRYGSHAPLGLGITLQQHHPPPQHPHTRPLLHPERAISKKLTLHPERLLWLLWLITRPTTLAHCRNAALAPPSYCSALAITMISRGPHAAP
jgi:hypothetical protein